MSRTITAARVAGPDGGLRPGWIRVQGAGIVAAGTGAPPLSAGDERQDLGDVTLVPGFVDIHCHGGGGANFGDGPDAARHAAAVHARHGTTAVMASLVTDTLEILETQIRSLAGLVRDGELLGIHLEGPWLSADHCGAHDPALLRDPEPADIERLLSAGEGTVRAVTLAPERPGGLAACAQLRRHGVTVCLGHSDATHSQTTEAITAGVQIATHLFNAQRRFDHREPGPALALIDDPAVTLELIADGIHVHPLVLRDVNRAAPGRVALVSDAMAAGGCGDGSYRLGPLTVEVHDGVARLPGTTTLAGSTLTLDRAIATMVRDAGLPLEQAITAATSTPARAVGAAGIGQIAPGRRADLVALDTTLAVVGVMRAGVWR